MVKRWKRPREALEDEQDMHSVSLPATLPVPRISPPGHLARVPHRHGVLSPLAFQWYADFPPFILHDLAAGVAHTTCLAMGHRQNSAEGSPMAVR